MKKGTFYINLRDGGFELKSGYIDSMTDNDSGSTYDIGFHHGNSCWVATHIQSGILIATGSTRKTCREFAQQRLYLITRSINSDRVQKTIARLQQFKKDTE